MPVETRRSKKNRKVTSAITGLSVSQVRKGLNKIRKLWKNNPENFSLLTVILENRSVQDFAFDFCSWESY